MWKYSGDVGSRGSRHDMKRDREAPYAPDEHSGEQHMPSSSAYPTKSASRKGKQRGRKEHAFEKRR